MRRFFIALFVLSVIATAGAVYWRSYLPEATSTAGAPAADSQEFSSRRGPSESRRQVPSERQDLALTISILSSVISALAALVQTWLTARAFRR